MKKRPWDEFGQKHAPIVWSVQACCALQESLWNTVNEMEVKIWEYKITDVLSEEFLARFPLK